MKVKGNGKLAVVGCQHGNERFGKHIIDDVHNNSDINPYVRTIFANEEAYNLNRRWIDTDLNRSFNRTDIVGHEAELAPHVLHEALQSKYLFDIHTTKADETFLPIITKLTKGVRYLLSHLENENIALIRAKEAPHSLIGNHPAAVSLEFGEDYSLEPEATRIALDAIKGALSGSYGVRRKKKIYEIDSLIPTDTDPLPDGIQSGEFSEVHGGYVLMPRATTYQGFLAKQFYEIDITENEGEDHE